MSTSSHHQLLLAGAFAPSAWDPTKNSDTYAYSNSNLTATLINISGSPSREIITTSTRNSGKRVFRIHMDGSGAWSTNFCLIGISDLFNPTGGPGGDAHGYGYYQQTGDLYYNLSVVASSGTTYDTGDVISVYVDFANTKLYFDKNGTYLFGGDAAAGTGGFTYLIGPGIFPSASMYPVNAGDVGRGMTLRTSITDVGSVPSGWKAWDAS